MDWSGILNISVVMEHKHATMYSRYFFALLLLKIKKKFKNFLSSVKKKCKPTL